ncbi:16S rRNA (uracil(1498)-N(3))-methyltransferase [Lysobacter korlensis]|uniref:Ribosomal RNA small subunit methyltransferase E n=1 Tax=Lysobacter korlensis TaxID=553636 RepID=A0ABV6RMM1_9GAMM
MSALFLSPGLTPGDAVVGASAVITGPEAKHATVNRVRAGERVSVGNGAGLIVTGPVVSVSPQELLVRIEEVRTEEAPHPELWLVQALAKGDRDELAVQAATELGVSGVIPWAAERSVVRWEGPKRSKGEERWRSIVREASKQSIRAFLPEVAPLATTAEVAGLAAADTVLVLEPSAEERLAAVTLSRAAGRVYLVVGPEGGIAPGELERFRSAGARPVRLGREVLRTSTAGPSALAVLSANSGRW